MAVSYDKELRRAAVQRGEQLATVSVGGFEFQGTLTMPEAMEVMDLIRKLFAAHPAKPDQPVAPFDTNDPRR